MVNTIISIYVVIVVSQSGLILKILGLGYEEST